MAHGYTLVNVLFYETHNMLHPKIQKAWNFMEKFQDVVGIKIVNTVIETECCFTLWLNRAKDEVWMTIVIAGNKCQFNLTLAECSVDFKHFLDQETIHVLVMRKNKKGYFPIHLLM